MSTMTLPFCERDLFYELEIPEEVMEEVEKLYPAPYLFGSRRMAQYWPWGGKADGSDWDFAFPYEGSEYKEVLKAEALGWTQRPESKYRDDLHFITWEKTVGGHRIQMCSKINLTLFRKTFESLDPPFYWRFLHKSSKEVLPKETQTAIFNQLYRIHGW